MPKLIIRASIASKDTDFLNTAAEMLKPQFETIKELLKTLPQVESSELDFHIEED